MMRTTSLAPLALCACLLSTIVAHAAGFQVNHYEPSTAGEYGFMVDKPWYSSTRYFALGLTMDYAHKPLVFGSRDADGNLDEIRPIIENALYGHLDLAFSLFDRLTFSGSVPVLLYDNGQTASGISPAQKMVLGDPRLGLMLRVLGHADKDPFSVHLGTNVWLPVDNTQLTGDSDVRVLPKLVFSGYANHLQWSVTGAYYFRKESVIGVEPGSAGNSIGPEVQIGAALAYADFEHHFSVGPEALLSTAVKDGHAFDREYSSLQTLLGFNVNIAETIQVGAAGGVGFFQQPGNPDARALLRLAYAPIGHTPKAPPPRVDADGDGVFDDLDRCLTEKEDLDGYQDLDGCPEPDNDADGVLDPNDQCPNEAGPKENVGCPDGDRDGDGFIDRVDQCANDAEDKDGFEDGDGCPDLDNDIDGVPDSIDQCPNQLGPASNNGCPESDRDGDSIIDRYDNCPDEFGIAANSGCAKKQLAKISDGRIEISQAVFFANGTANIGKVSFPMLNNVAQILKLHPELDVKIEGHTDNVGKEGRNKLLSQRRADAVHRYLVKQGVPATRITAIGYGSSQPIESNATKQGRAKNRRVVFSTSVHSNAVPAGGVQ